MQRNWVVVSKNARFVNRDVEMPKADFICKLLTWDFNLSEENLWFLWKANVTYSPDYVNLAPQTVRFLTIEALFFRWVKTCWTRNTILRGQQARASSYRCLSIELLPQFQWLNAQCHLQNRTTVNEYSKNARQPL